MAPRLSGQNCKIFKFPLSLNSQKRLRYKENNTKYRGLTWKPRSHVRILIYRTRPIQAMTYATIQNQMCTWWPRSVAVAQKEFSRLSNHQSDGLYSRSSLQNEADQRYRTQERDTLFYRTPQAAIYVPILHAQRLASSLYQQCWLSEWKNLELHLDQLSSNWRNSLPQPSYSMKQRLLGIRSLRFMVRSLQHSYRSFLVLSSTAKPNTVCRGSELGLSGAI